MNNPCKQFIHGDSIEVMYSMVDNRQESRRWLMLSQKGFPQPKTPETNSPIAKL
jgi:hypothetical protein